MSNLTFKEYIQDTYDKDELKDIAEHGCAGGVPGMIYYTETTALYDKYESEIWGMLQDDAEDFGFKSVLEFISTLGGAKDADTDYRFKNLLVWYAAERVAREVVDRE